MTFFTKLKVLSQSAASDESAKNAMSTGRLPKPVKEHEVEDLSN